MNRIALNLDITREYVLLSSAYFFLEISCWFKNLLCHIGVAGFVLSHSQLSKRYRNFDRNKTILLKEHCCAISSIVVQLCITYNSYHVIAIKAIQFLYYYNIFNRKLIFSCLLFRARGVREKQFSPDNLGLFCVWKKTRYFLEFFEVYQKVKMKYFDLR